MSDWYHSHGLVLGLFSQVSVEEDEEIFHLGAEDLLGLGVLDVIGHPVELISHGLGGNTGASGRDDGRVGGRLGCHSMDIIRSGGVRGVVRLYVSEVVPELLRRWSKNVGARMRTHPVLACWKSYSSGIRGG